MVGQTPCKSIPVFLYALSNVSCSPTAIYAQGVGLGAAKAREIGKFAEGYSGYVQQAQEAVSSSRKFRDVLSTLPIQNFVLNHTVHIRPANAMEIEALKSIVYYLFLGSKFGHAVWIICFRYNEFFLIGLS